MDREEETRALAAGMQNIDVPREEAGVVTQVDDVEPCEHEGGEPDHPEHRHRWRHRHESDR